MWQIPVLIGLVTVGVGVGAATKRKALPADIAGMIRSGLQSRNDDQLQAILTQLHSKYRRQVDLIYKAWGATKAHDGNLNVPADIDALYMNAFHSGDAIQMAAVAQALDVKYHFLSTHLLDVGSLLKNLVPTVAPVAAPGATTSAGAPAVPTLAPAALPADVAGTVKVSMQSRNAAQLQAALAAIAGKYPQQVSYLSSAWAATKMPDGTLAVPSDIDAMYQNAFFSGNATTMKQTATALQGSYPTLATALNGVASIVGG